MATFIPGSETLGYSFDIQGGYNANSKLTPLFEMKFESDTYKDWVVPSNANLDPTPNNYGQSNVFTTRQKFEEHFGSKVGIKVGIGLFSGEFEASFNMTNKSDVSYEYGLVETYSKFYSLVLKDPSEKSLAPWVKDDEDFKNIPDVFNDENRLLFFRFFEKYGLYYISRVDIGARLYYSTSVDKSYNFSESEIKTKISAEYTAVFSANAEAEWKKVGESWASARQVKVSATGGSNVILNVLVPGYGANHADAFKAWYESAELNPGVIDFHLTPISKIFSGQKAVAVTEAIEAYNKHKLYIESKTGSCLINFNNRNVLPPPTGEFKVYGFQLVAIDRINLNAEFKKSYTTWDYWNGYEAIYDSMLKDIQKFNNSRYIIAFTTFSTFALTAPTPGFVDFLRNCGAEVELETWLDTKVSNYAINSCCALVHNNYAMVGIPGSEKGTAHERYDRTGSCDTGGINWWYGSSFLDLPAPMVSLNVDLYLLKDKKLDQDTLTLHLSLPKGYKKSVDTMKETVMQM